MIQIDAIFLKENVGSKKKCKIIKAIDKETVARDIYSSLHLAFWVFVNLF
jgi:hypothetical protein